MNDGCGSWALLCGLVELSAALYGLGSLLVMPSAPKIVPLQLPPRPAEKLKASTTERGYGHEHQKQRAELIALHPICQRCNDQWSAHLHHRDRNPHNRALDNVEVICERCHQAEHRARSRPFA